VPTRQSPAVRCALWAVLAAGSLGLGGCRDAAGPKRLRIAVIPKGTTHEFWKSIHAGALQAGQELDVEILWKGPAKEDDRIGQVQVVEDFTTKGVSGIVLAPLDDQALATPVAEAKAAGIPTLVIDSDLAGDRHVSFVATDNEKGGALAAERLGALLGGAGRALMLRYQEGSASTAARERGFSETLKAKYPGVRLVSENQYGGATAESAYKAAENLLTAQTDVDGIFCPNESTTFGMLRALEDAQRLGKVKFVGFDGSAKLAEALRANKIQGLVLQDPVRMGHDGVRTLVQFLRGADVPKRIDTGAVMATPENAATPAIAKLLVPEVPAAAR
jgi:ribose transport system substrate-binding protein